MSVSVLQQPNRSTVRSFSARFQMQSYFDSTLLEKALVSQFWGDRIVAATVKEMQVAGFAVGLSTSSQTPVAVQFLSSAGADMSDPQILKPGNILRPSDEVPFGGIRWGLPFGWLGGGLAQLNVYTTPGAYGHTTGNPEVIFHRVRVKIQQDSIGLFSNYTTNANWPTRFPWPDALSGTTSVQQGGAPLFAVEPTRTLLRPLVNLTTPLPVRAIWNSTIDFDFESAGVADQYITNSFSFVDFTIPSAAGGNFSQSQPIIEFTSGPLVRLGCEGFGTGLVFTDLGAAALTNQFIDIVRYGRL